MDRKQIAVIAGTAFVVAVIIVIGLVTRKNGGIGSMIFGPETSVSGTSSSGTSSANQEPKLFSLEVPKNREITVPKNQAPASVGSSNIVGTYEVSISPKGFSLNRITVKVGNIAQIKFTAVDGAYDVEIPYLQMYTSVPQGQTKLIAFQATTVGTFVFQCRDRCPETNGKGELLVIPE